MVKQNSELVLRVKVTNGCNMSCFFCHHEGGHNATPMSIEQIRTLAQFAYQNGFTKIHLTGGEPTIHPQLLEIVKIIKSYGLTCSLTTNGQFQPNLLDKLQDAGLDSCNFSFHTIRPEMWAQIQQHGNIQYSQKQIDGLINNIRKSQEIGIFTKVNIVVGEDSSLTLEVIELISSMNIEIRLLDILGNKKSIENIHLILRELGAKEVETIYYFNSSDQKIVYSTNLGSITVKSIGNRRLRSVCEGCQLPCLEGFYNTRVEAENEKINIRLCLQRNDSPAVIELSKFAKSAQLAEITANTNSNLQKEASHYVETNR